VTGASGLDHVGIAGRDLAALAGEFSALGFTLTPTARHSGRRTPDGKVERYGTGNRCAMLRQGYLELISVVDPAAWTLGLDRFLARREGAFILALAMDDPEAELERLRRAGIDLPGVAHLERPVDDADPGGLQARFALLALPEAPEGRLQLIAHRTRESLWQARFLDHANHAVALTEVTIVADSPAESAARLSLLAGRPVTPDPEGGFRIALAQGVVRMRAAEAGEASPGIAGVALRTDDGNAAVTALLAGRGIAHTAEASGVTVAAGGVTLRFTAG
jgi:hypothetical protein